MNYQARIDDLWRKRKSANTYRAYANDMKHFQLKHNSSGHLGL